MNNPNPIGLPGSVVTTRTTSEFRRLVEPLIDLTKTALVPDEPVVMVEPSGQEIVAPAASQEPGTVVEMTTVGSVGIPSNPVIGIPASANPETGNPQQPQEAHHEAREDARQQRDLSRLRPGTPTSTSAGIRVNPCRPLHPSESLTVNTTESNATLIDQEHKANQSRLKSGLRYLGGAANELDNAVSELTDAAALTESPELCEKLTRIVLDLARARTLAHGCLSDTHGLDLD